MMRGFRNGNTRVFCQIVSQTRRLGTRATTGQSKIYDSVLDTIGNTPTIKVNHLGPPGVNLYVKAEYFNPAASVKDRLAVSIIEEAEKSGALKPGQTVVEATSGNTGVGLAMVCAAKGYPCVIVMADSFSIERRRLMRFLGCKVVLTPREWKGFGMIKKAQELASKHGWFLASQFESDANALVHKNTTAREILSDFKGKNLDYWVTGYGTGGTVSGVGEVLRKESPGTKIILSEPDVAALIGSGISQTRNSDHTPESSHPAWTPHPIQGWTPDFISHVLQESIDKNYFDELIPVKGSDGIVWAKKLASEEGIITGISGGSTFKVSLDIAEKAAPGTNILCMLPDTAERYMSSPLFEDIDAEMNEEEVSISESTPGYWAGTAPEPAV